MAEMSRMLKMPLSIYIPKAKKKFQRYPAVTHKYKKTYDMREHNNFLKLEEKKY